MQNLSVTPTSTYQNLLRANRIILAVALVALVGCDNWDRTGYGDVVALRDDAATYYAYTRATCLEVAELDDETLEAVFNGAKLVEEDVLETYDGGIPGLSFPIRLHGKSELPEACQGEGLIETASPTTTFEHFWHNFNDYYAFFEERGVDWAAQYAAFAGQVNDEMSDEALFDVLKQMLSPISDGHVGLVSDEFGYYSPYKERGKNKVIEDSFAEQDQYDDLQEYSAAVENQYKEIRRGYLDSDLVERGNGKLAWGSIAGRIGYLSINAMEELATTEDEDPDAQAEVAVVNKTMPQILADFRDMDAIIIDIRFNDGGRDEVSLAIASYFADRRFTALSKVARSYQGETQPVSVELDPTANPWLKPVAVIGGPDSYSAAETFLMAMRALPHVKLVGQPSNGILSDRLGKTLPNGWVILLSNEVYFDFEGKNYEVTGVPVDIEAPTFSLEEIAEKRNVAIDTAIAALGH